MTVPPTVRPPGGRPWRRVRVVAGGAAVASVLALLPATSGTAAAAPGDGVTLTVSTTRVDQGRPLTLAGTVRLDGRKASRVRLRVMAREGTRWRVLRAVRTDTAGRYRHVVKPRTSVRFRVETVRSSRVRLHVSPARLVRVRPATSISLATSAGTVDRGRPGTVRGTVRSAGRTVPGVGVTLEAWRGGRWTRLAVVRTDARGAFAQRVTPTTTTTYRARTAPTTSRAAGTATVALGVRPVLADLTPSGRSYAVRDVDKTVEGRLVGVAGQSVRLQQRVAEGAWTTVASGRTGRDGRFALSTRIRTSQPLDVRVVALPGNGLQRLDGPVLPLDVRASAYSVLADDPPCLGARAVADRGCHNPRLDGLVLPTTDRSDLWLETGNAFGWCFLGTVWDKVTSCRRGSTAADAPRVALVGDSHAVGYLASGGLVDEMTRENLHLVTFTGRGCRWLDRSDIPTVTDPGPEPGAVDYDLLGECNPRGDDIQQRLLAEDYDLVVVTGLRMKPSYGPDDVADRARRHATAWMSVMRAGVPVLALADNGDYPQDAQVFDCVTGARVASRVQACSAPHELLFGGADPLRPAVDRANAMAEAEGLDVRARYADLTEFFCPGGGPGRRCPQVVGNVVVQRDRHHLSGLYAATMGRYVVAEILADLGRP